MSAAAEKRSRGAQHQRQPSSRGGHQAQQPKPNAQNPNQPQQPAQLPATNVWSKGVAGIGRGRPLSGVSTPNADGKQGPSASNSGNVTPATSIPQVKTSGDIHAPVKGFNSKEIRDFLQKHYSDTIPSVQVERACLYKSEGAVAAKRASMGAWSAKPHAMSNGKDFWVTLSQQIASAESQHRGG